ncbi:MAG: hypothetical protein HGA19_08575, partial [Oscillochloris sp.]|nr:hypothetical protein [Oscillochloris sp.]
FQGSLEAVWAISNERDRAKALTALAPQLLQELLPTALEIARTIAAAGARAEALGKLAPQLPAAEQPGVYQTALEGPDPTFVSPTTSLGIVYDDYALSITRMANYSENIAGEEGTIEEGQVG